MAFASMSKPQSKKAAPVKRGSKRRPVTVHQRVNAGSGFEAGFQPLSLPIQTKLKIGEPNDKYEQEADRVADQVMRMPESQVQREFEPIQEQFAGNSIQRMDYEEEEMMQTKPAVGMIQRMCSECEDEEKLQRMEMEEEEETLQTKSEGSQVSNVTPNIQNGISRLRQSGGAALPDSTRAFMEPRFGHDFTNVKIHTDSQAAELSQSVNARAFTVGGDIFFNHGEYQPGNRRGQELLAHELTHAIQQSSRDKGDSVNRNFVQRAPRALKKRKVREAEAVMRSINMIVTCTTTDPENWAPTKELPERYKDLLILWFKIAEDCPMNKREGLEGDSFRQALERAYEETKPIIDILISDNSKKWRTVLQREFIPRFKEFESEVKFKLIEESPKTTVLAGLTFEKNPKLVTMEEFFEVASMQKSTRYEIQGTILAGTGFEAGDTFYASKSEERLVIWTNGFAVFFVTNNQIFAQNGSSFVHEIVLGIVIKAAQNAAGMAFFGHAWGRYYACFYAFWRSSRCCRCNQSSNGRRLEWRPIEYCTRGSSISK